MPTNEEERYRVSVLIRNEQDVLRAKELFTKGGSKDIHVYDAIVTGWATKPMVRSLRQMGFVVERSRREARNDGTMKKPTRGAQAAMGKLRNLAKQSSLPELMERGAPGLSGVGNPLAFAPEVLVAHLVSFRGPIRPAWRDELRNLDLRYECKLDDDTYRMLLNPTQLARVRELDFVSQVEREPDRVTEGVVDKWEKSLLEPSPASLTSVDTGPGMQQMYDVILHRAEDVAKVLELLAGMEQIQVLDRGHDRIRILAPVNAPALAVIPTMPQVSLLADYEAPLLFCNETLTTIGCRSKIPHAAATFPWTGKGVKVGIYDSGADATHPDLGPAIAKVSARPGAILQDTIGHGSHVAGLIAGRGVQSNGRVRGVASDASLYVTSMVTASASLILPTDFKDLFGDTLGDGVQIVNLSWGTPISGDYDQGAVQIDDLAYHNPGVLFVIAAGNSGVALNGQHKFKTIGTPASAKNALTVGAHGVTCADNTCQNHALTWGQFRPQKFPQAPAANEPRCPAAPGTVSAFSSRGPTDYDSIKPDLLAPGVLVESVRSQIASTQSGRLFDSGCPVLDSQFYVCCSGTSMAAPIISGAAAVLIEYLRDVRNTPTPSSALVKALLLAAARPVSQPSPERAQENTIGIGYPDFDQGFGLMDLSLLLPHTGASPGRRIEFTDIGNDSPLALASRQPTGAPRKSQQVYRFDVLPGATEWLTLVLCWTDWPASSVQNNLDLLLGTPDGIFAGNQMHKFRKDPLFDDIGEGGIVLDKRNNVEVIHIKQPAAGSYEIRVIAENTSQPFLEPRQGYGLVIVGEISQLQSV